MGYLVIASVGFWLMVMGYLFLLSLRQKRLERRLGELDEDSQEKKGKLTSLPQRINMRCNSFIF